MKRFGDYILDMSAAPADLNGHLELSQDLFQPRVAVAGTGFSPDGPTSENNLGSRIRAWLPRTRSTSPARGADPLPRTRDLPRPGGEERLARRWLRT